MSCVNLKAYKVSRIDFNNNVNGMMKLNFSNKISHNVRFSRGEICEGTMEVSVFDKENKDALNITLVLKGVFDITKQVEQEFIHVETFKELFPIAKAIITSISANAGIPPIIIKNVDIEKQNIYRFDMNGMEDGE